MSGNTILHYEILEKLGSGGMGEVFKAHDKRLNRHVAIKVLSAAKSGAPERRRRFLQEAQSASALNHPNIITIHDILDEGETQYLVMEYVSGKTLHAMIPSIGLRLAQVLQYASQMADALSVAHAAGIVHRDFKPANVMITSSGLVKILDFGLAKLTERRESMNGSTASVSAPGDRPGFGDQLTATQSPLTTEGSILGTVNYMSPEQAEGKVVDARSDIFSFGAVLYEMATGHRAFQGDSDISTITAVLRDEVKPIAEIAPEVPPELEQVITLCLVKQPGSRWQSMREVEMTLNALKRRADAGVLHKRFSMPLSAPPPSATALPPTTAGPRVSAAAITTAPSMPGANKRTARVVIGGIAGVLILSAVAAGWWWSRQHKPAPSPVAPVQTPTPQVSKPSPISSEPAAATPAEPPAPAPETPPPAAAVTAPRQNTPGTSAPAVPRAIPAPTATVAPAPPVSKPDQPRVSAQPVAVSIADGLPIRIALAEDVPVNAVEGRAVSFRVVEDLKVGNTILIARGATVTGSIASEAGKKKFLGMGGKMTFQLATADAVDGQKLKVRASAGRKETGPTTRPIDTGKYAKAKDLAAARGTDYIAYIDGDQTVSVKK
jgi:serine/threonine protein kinase